MNATARNPALDDPKRCPLTGRLTGCCNRCLHLIQHQCTLGGDAVRRWQTRGRQGGPSVRLVGGVPYVHPRATECPGFEPVHRRGTWYPHGVTDREHPASALADIDDGGAPCPW